MSPRSNASKYAAVMWRIWRIASATSSSDKWLLLGRGDLDQVPTEIAHKIPVLDPFLQAPTLVPKVEGVVVVAGGDELQGEAVDRPQHGELRPGRGGDSVLIELDEDSGHVVLP
jgi:hypothetical protein